MLPEQVVALRHQLLEARKLAGRIATVAEQRQLEPALVVVVDRLEELRGIRRVDEDGNLQPRAGIPDRIELGIVELQARSVRFARAQAEPFADLADADGAGLQVGFELLRRPFRPAGSDVGEVDARQHAHAILVRDCSG